MHEAIIISAAMLGFAGSLHCVGMCGPIALSVPAASGSGVSRMGGLFTYFLGKTITYIVLGMLFGLLGQQLVLAGFQQALSLVLGIAMLLFALVTIFKPALFHYNQLTVLIGNKLAPIMGSFVGRRTYASSLVLGMLNGLLPCGLVYVAISAATATGSMMHAAAFMGVFGVATMPLMLSLVLFTAQLGLGYRNQVRKWLPAFTAIVAVLLILRGLDLGIPYVSPHLENATRGTAASCH